MGKSLYVWDLVSVSMVMEVNAEAYEFTRQSSNTPQLCDVEHSLYIFRRLEMSQSYETFATFALGVFESSVRIEERIRAQISSGVVVEASKVTMLEFPQIESRIEI